MDYIFDDENGPFNLWLSGKEQPVFEGDDFNWLNLNENDINAAITGKNDANQLLNVTSCFRYSTAQQLEDIHNSESESEIHLSLPTSPDGSRGGGPRGDGGNEDADEIGSSE